MGRSRQSSGICMHKRDLQPTQNLWSSQPLIPMPPLKQTKCPHFKCLSEKERKLSGRKEDCRKKREKFKLPLSLPPSNFVEAIQVRCPHLKGAAFFAPQIKALQGILTLFPGPFVSLYVNCLRQSLEEARARKPKGHSCKQWISPFISWSRHGFCLCLSQV